MRFVLPDGSTRVPLTSTFGTKPDPDAPTLVASVFNPRDEKAGRSSRSLPVARNADGWSFPLSSEDAVTFSFSDTRFENALLRGRPYAEITPGEEDVTLTVPLLPGRTVRLDAADFAPQPGSGHAWLPFASAAVVRDGNDAIGTSRRRDGTLWRDALELPTETTLLIVNPEPKVAALLLDADVAKARVDWSRVKRTVIEGVSFDGTPISARILGVVAVGSGIPHPIDVRYLTEKLADEAGYASRAVFDLITDTPLAAVVEGYNTGAAGDTVPQVVPLTPGETHTLTFERGRVLWADLMRPGGEAFRGELRSDVSWTTDEGVRITVDNNFYRSRFPGVPDDRPLTLEVRSHDWPGRMGLQRGTVTLDPSGHFEDGTAVVGVTVSEGKPGELVLAADWDRSLEDRDRTRERARQTDGRW